MNPETYPHRKDTPYGTSPDCRCGADDAGAVGIGATFGENCPAALREALAKAEGERETIRLQALTAAANATMADMEREEESDAMFLRLTEAEKERDAALARVAELERATPGPHIPPALMRRVEALGFVPGSGEPVGWLLGYVEGMAALLTTAQGELAATLVSERAAGMDAAAREVDRMASDVGDIVNLLGAGCSDRMRSVVTKVAEAVLKDAAMAVRAASDALAARSAGGGGS